MSQNNSTLQSVFQTAPKSVTVVALFVFFLSNFILNMLLLSGPSKYMDTNLAQSRDVFAFVDSNVEKPNVAFFGSSVVEVPLALMDNEDEYVGKCHTCGRYRDEEQEMQGEAFRRRRYRSASS